ncbi:MAG: RDD family protein [Flavobacterium sp.]|nr:MAG: RDD family protein [Flavobacterium sp.]
MNDNEFRISNYLLAPLELRMANLLLDWLFRSIIMVCIVMLLDAVFFRNNVFTISEWIDELDSVEEIVFKFATMFVYYLITETLMSRSFAKYITGTIVVLEDGSKPKFETILTRSAYRLIPFEFFTFLQNNSRGWHDQYSKTYVVKKRRLDEKTKDFLIHVHS